VFDGVNDEALTVDDHADWDLGEVFTIEVWVKATGLDPQVSVPIMSSGDFTGSSTAGWMMAVWTTGSTPRLGFLVNNTWNNATSQEFTLNIWHHCAVTRRSGLYTMWMDGIKQHSFVYSTVPVTGTSLRIGKGAYLGVRELIGYLDQVRISKGIVRYGDYAVPTSRNKTTFNSDTQVITSNSTFGTGAGLFTADAYTALLLQGDGTGFAGTAGDTFTDESASPGLGAKTVTNGTSAVTLRQGRGAFGANAYYFTGSSGSKLSLASSSDYAMGTGAFTVEMWVNFDAVAADQFIMGTTSGTDNDFDLYADCTGTDQGWVMYLNDTSYRAHYKHSQNSWQHVCVQRDSNQILDFYVNGARIHSAGVVNSNILADSFALGQQWNNGGRFAGYMDGIRISKGIARYGYTGTNVKQGLSAVHHSHCKLLISSNVYTPAMRGSMEIGHIDDLSDQGNYWGQTPYSYTFDGAGDEMTGTDTAIGPNWMTGWNTTGFSGACWFNYYTGHPSKHCPMRVPPVDGCPV
jgi:hypothetical protein